MVCFCWQLLLKETFTTWGFGDLSDDCDSIFLEFFFSILYVVSYSWVSFVLPSSDWVMFSFLISYLLEKMKLGCSFCICSCTYSPSTWL